MKQVLAGALVAAMVLVACGSALAYEPKVWDDYSWWGNSGATPEPFKDPVRRGYWWWPTAPASYAGDPASLGMCPPSANGDMELWGNRGVVYHIWEPAPVAPPVTPPPPTVEPPKAARQIPVLNHILFDFDKAVLKPEGQAEANKVVQWMKDNPQDTVLIEGHTCDIGSNAYNEALGKRRAEAVQRYLIENGIAPDRVAVQSFGETSPAVANADAASRKLNRRAVFMVTLGD
ncbi:MAG: OmpA family protein [Candidatus Hydrogenedentes bacterium]|nr:OmpA family protein [Candidatus Hydrogenedentota bacterium]